MPTLPTNPHYIGDAGHVNDHNKTVTALAAAAYISGTNITDVAGTAKLGLGAWTSYTPSWSGITSTGGTSSGKYIAVGKTILFWAKYVCGSTAINITNGITPNLPVTPADAEAMCITGHISDVSSGRFLGVMIGATLYVANAGGSYVYIQAPSNTVPMTWANGDFVLIAGSYEAA